MLGKGDLCTAVLAPKRPRPPLAITGQAWRSGTLCPPRVDQSNFANEFLISTDGELSGDGLLSGLETPNPHLPRIAS